MKFNWQKKGMVFDIRQNKLPLWVNNSLLQPTPILLDDGEIIRIYVGMRDESGQGRIGFVDVSSKNPTNILAVSENPALDLGGDGAFDDSGVVPSAIIFDGGEYHMYYAGYSLLKKVRFSVLGGLAKSSDGKSFKRVSTTPVFERAPEHMLFRVPHSIMRENNKYRIWYGGGSSFMNHENYTYPIYDIYYCETDNLENMEWC
jgi:hypothetical protein